MAFQEDREEKFLVTSADVDFEQKLKISSLTNYLIQISWHHAEDLGWGVDDLLKYNLVWVLSGLHIKLDKYPDWRETITVITWPKGINRLFYLRDYLIKNETGEIIGRATSNWLMIDIDKRRPKLHELDDLLKNANKNRHAIEEVIPMLRQNNEVISTTDFAVRYSDVDLNKHLTTTRYVDWVMDTFSPDEVENKRPKSFMANFVKEVRFGREVKMIKSQSSENAQQFEMIDDEGKSNFRALIEY